MKRVLVTGGAGFIGHHLIEYLLDNTDFEIVSLDRLDFSGSLNRLHDILKNRRDAKRVKIVYHDLRASVNEHTADLIGDINIVLHLGASSHVTRSIKYPMEFVENNVNGTVNILEFARTLNNLERLVYFSTDEVFGPAVPDTTFKEYDRFNPTNPYSASKAAGEAMAVAYENTYNLPIYITHTMNVYGERQSTEKFIPLCMKKIINDDKLTIHYDSKTGKIGGRCYLHAKDVASALLFILKQPTLVIPENTTSGRCVKINIASTEELNNLEVASILASGVGTELNYELIDPSKDRPGHDFKYSISGEYLRAIGWEQEYKAADAIPQLARWFDENRDWIK